MNRLLPLMLAFLTFPVRVSADSWLYGGLSAGKGPDTMAYGLHVGTGILPLIGLEAGYVQHTDFADGDRNVSVSSLYAAVKPSINVGGLQVYAKGGLHTWFFDTNDSPRDGFGTMLSVGADYQVFGPLALGANYTNFVLDGQNVGTYNLTVTMHLL